MRRVSSTPDRRREELRQTFATVATLYDRVRPTYPAELLDDLAARIRRGRVLEIGPGTGQATVPLAERGFEIVALELGVELAALARAKLARFPTASIVDANFETGPPAANSMLSWHSRRSIGSTRRSDTRELHSCCGRAAFLP